MSLRKVCPCDHDGVCPFDAQYMRDCEYWCSADEPEEHPEEEEENDD